MVKRIPHSYTLVVKMVPIHILEGLKRKPHPAAHLYTFIMEVKPPPPYQNDPAPVANTRAQLRVKMIPVYKFIKG